jgi:hypothetical protein
MKEIETEEYKRPAILDEMDSYNTAPIEQSGSIMEGILSEQQGITSAETTLEPAHAEPTKKELPNDYLPLNSSIQELTKLVSDKFTNYDKRFNEITSNFDAVRQPAQPQAPQPQYQYDPEAPVTMAHLQQMVQAYTGVNQSATEARKEAAKTRGYVEYMRFKQDNPDFDLDPREIDATVDQAYKTGQPQVVTNANWTGHFENTYSKTRVGKLVESNKRIAELEKELETYKKRPVATTTTPVSPAIGRTTTRAASIDSPLSEGNDDVKQMKSYIKRGDFKKFGNELKPRFGIAK